MHSDSTLVLSRVKRGYRISNVIKRQVLVTNNKRMHMEIKKRY